MPHIAVAVFVRCQMVGFPIDRLWSNFDSRVIRCFTHTESKLTHYPFFWRGKPYPENTRRRV